MGNEGKFAIVGEMLGRFVVLLGDHRIKGTWKSKKGAEIQASNINMAYAVAYQRALDIEWNKAIEASAERIEGDCYGESDKGNEVRMAFNKNQMALAAVVRTMKRGG